MSSSDGGESPQPYRALPAHLLSPLLTPGRKNARVSRELPSAQQTPERHCKPDTRRWRLREDSEISRSKEMRCPTAMDMAPPSHLENASFTLPALTRDCTQSTASMQASSLCVRQPVSS